MTLWKLHLSITTSPLKVIQDSVHFQKEWKVLYLNSRIYSFQCVTCLLDSLLVKPGKPQNNSKSMELTLRAPLLLKSDCFTDGIRNRCALSTISSQRIWTMTLRLPLIHFPAAQWTVPYNFSYQTKVNSPFWGPQEYVTWVYNSTV